MHPAERRQGPGAHRDRHGLGEVGLPGEAEERAGEPDDEDADEEHRQAARERRDEHADRLDDGRDEQRPPLADAGGERAGGQVAEQLPDARASRRAARPPRPRRRARAPRRDDRRDRARARSSRAASGRMPRRAIARSHGPRPSSRRRPRISVTPQDPNDWASRVAGPVSRRNDGRVAGIPWTGGVSAGEVASGPTTVGPLHAPERHRLHRAAAAQPLPATPTSMPCSPASGRRSGLAWRGRGHRRRWLSPSSVAAPMATIVLGLVFFGVLARPSRRATSWAASPPARPGLRAGARWRSSPGWSLCGLLAARRRPAGRARRDRARLRRARGGRAPVVGPAQAAGGSWPGPSSRPRSRCRSAFPAYHLVVLGHLLTLAPLGFLWEWSRRPARGERPARLPGRPAARLVGVPVLLLSGALDGWLSTDPGQVRSVVGDGAADPARHDPAGHRGHARWPRGCSPSWPSSAPGVCRVARLLPPRGPGRDRGRRGAAAVGDGSAGLGGSLHGRGRARRASSRSTSAGRPRCSARSAPTRCCVGVALPRRAGRLRWSIRRSRKSLAPASESTYGRSTEPEGR